MAMMSIIFLIVELNGEELGGGFGGGTKRSAVLTGSQYVNGVKQTVRVNIKL